MQPDRLQMLKGVPNNFFSTATTSNHSPKGKKANPSKACSSIELGFILLLLLKKTQSSSILSLAMLSGKVAVITGAGRGIGRAAANMFAKQGASVVVNDISEQVADETVDEIRRSSATSETSASAVVAFPGSVTRDDFATDIAEFTLSQYGKCDVLVNNAGYLWDGVVHKMDDKQWQSILDCHGTAPFRMIRAFAPLLRDAGKAELEQHGRVVNDRCIINVSSTTGLHGNVGQINYAFAKAGVIGMTKTMAKEWGKFGVRCNAVAYGMIDTRLTSAFENDDDDDGDDNESNDNDKISIPQGLPPDVAAMWESPQTLQTFVPLCRKGTVDEAAGAMLFLASPLATYVTGHTLEVTGGMGI